MREHKTHLFRGAVKRDKVTHYRCNEPLKKNSLRSYNKFCDIDCMAYVLKNGKCKHTITKGRDNEKGSWCARCGVKVLDVDERECKDCKYFFKGAMNYTGCNKHLMAVTPSMRVTYKILNGTCWEKVSKE